MFSYIDMIANPEVADTFRKRATVYFNEMAATKNQLLNANFLYYKFCLAFINETLDKYS